MKRAAKRERNLGEVVRDSSTGLAVHCPFCRCHAVRMSKLGPRSLRHSCGIPSLVLLSQECGLVRADSRMS